MAQRLRIAGGPQQQDRDVGRCGEREDRRSGGLGEQANDHELDFRVFFSTFPQLSILANIDTVSTNFFDLGQLFWESVLRWSTP
jgi:hypothetical protein